MPGEKKEPTKLFADYEEYNARQQDRQIGIETGESPETMDMAFRLEKAGLSSELAMIAAKQMMGLSSTTQATTPEQDWGNYQKAHPVMANSKRLLGKATIPLRGAASALAAPAHLPDAEKLSAHKMLKEYLHAQDMQRANEVDKEGLWMLARMPGAPLAGQPVYGGPMTAGPIDPLRTPEQATQNNQVYAAQGNRRY